MRIHILQILFPHSAFFSESKEMHTLDLWHDGTAMKKYLITPNCGDTAEGATEGRPEALAETRRHILCRIITKALLADLGVLIPTSCPHMSLSSPCCYGSLGSPLLPSEDSDLKPPS